MNVPKNKVILSGIQPSGMLHLGNYLGAVKQWVELQADNTAYFCIVDEHAITVDYEPKDLPDRVMDAAALYISCGVNPGKSTIFVQSHVPAHTELGWLLGTITRLGELRRMTQYKEKVKKQTHGKHAEESSLGLFAYPVLQAADILLYHPDLVPVGEDQVQHIELTRDIAERFNNRFGKVFKIPEAYVNEDTSRIMSLTDPEAKMSKSDQVKSYIALTDTPENIRKKISSAVTESEPVISFEKSGPAVKNMLTIYQALSGERQETIEEAFAGKGYKEFKEELAGRIISSLAPIRATYQEIRKDDTELRVILGRGMHQAQEVANQTLQQVKEKMGLI